MRNTGVNLPYGAVRNANPLGIIVPAGGHSIDAASHHLHTGITA
jgi:hypothetical protein